jgi:hypothetical protein
MGLLESYDRQVKGMKKEALRMCWLMRGGMTYTEILNLGAVERELIGEISKENVETTKASKLPYF